MTSQQNQEISCGISLCISNTTRSPPVRTLSYHTYLPAVQNSCLDSIDGYIQASSSLCVDNIGGSVRHSVVDPIASEVGQISRRRQFDLQSMRRGLRRVQHLKSDASDVSHLGQSQGAHLEVGQYFTNEMTTPIVYYFIFKRGCVNRSISSFLTVGPILFALHVPLRYIFCPF